MSHETKGDRGTGAWTFPGLGELAMSRIQDFARDGFVVLGTVLDNARTAVLAERFAAVFRGEFETSNLPDGWFWQEGTSDPDVPRHMANVWKCDLSFARYVLSPDLGCAVASLAGWPAVRLAQDTLWLKPPNWPEGEFHQDRLAFLDPADGLTCWLAIDDARPDHGTLQYVRGSHRWTQPEGRWSEAIVAPESRKRMLTAAAANAALIDIVPLNVPAGTLVVHSGNIWHGSSANHHALSIRRAIGVHFIRFDTKFSDPRGGYIFGRYKRIGSFDLDDSFFPVTWSEQGGRTPTLDRFCATGELG
jgi:phytanoyl-CoA hydroxylase